MSLTERNVFWKEAFSKLSTCEKAKLQKEASKEKEGAFLHSDENKAKLIKRHIGDLEKICENLEKLGVPSLCIYVHKKQLHGTGSVEGLSFIKEQEAFQTKFLLHCGAENEKSHERDEDLSVLKEKVQKLFNEKYIEAAGKPQRVPYAEIFSNKIKASVHGLPDGVNFRKPCTMGKPTLAKILEVADKIKFVIQSTSASQNPQDNNGQSILEIMKSKGMLDIDTYTDLQAGQEDNSVNNHDNVQVEVAAGNIVADMARGSTVMVHMEANDVSEIGDASDISNLIRQTSAKISPETTDRLTAVPEVKKSTKGIKKSKGDGSSQDVQELPAKRPRKLPPKLKESPDQVVTKKIEKSLNSNMSKVSKILHKKGTFLTVRAEKDEFFLCQTEQNVSELQKKFQIIWYTKVTKKGHVYRRDYQDHTEVDCVIKVVHPTKINSELVLLSEAEYVETLCLLKEAQQSSLY